MASSTLKNRLVVAADYAATAVVVCHVVPGRLVLCEDHDAPANTDIQGDLY